MTSDADFPRLGRNVHESWLVRAGEWSAAAWLAMAAQSTTVLGLRRTRERILLVPRPARVRAVAVAVAVAAATHLVLLQFMPRHIAPMVPQSFWLLVAATASIVAFSADRVSHAWHSSGVARAWRALSVD